MGSDVGPVPLHAADDEGAFGGKAVSLGAAIRAGLPVPSGAALAARSVDRVAAGESDAVAALLASAHIPISRLVVRSSAVGEDSSDASFAGQHATKLNVTKPQLREAVREVWASARTASAMAYRARKGLPATPRIGVVVQMLVEPVAAGVLFTRNPLTGAEEHIIEAAWGLGEAVVSGAVVPDRFTLDARGRVIDRAAGEKDVKIWYGEDDGVVEMSVPAELREELCLTDANLAALHDLAERCQREWGPALDIEWAIAADASVYLLQCRPITTLGRA